MRLKVKLFHWFVISSLCLDVAQGVALQRAALDDDCDFDFREQPEDFMGFDDVGAVSDVKQLRSHRKFTLHSLFPFL